VLTFSVSAASLNGFGRSASKTGRLLWAIEENPADTSDKQKLPTPGSATGNPLEYEVNTDGVGSFAIVLYYDAYVDHEFDPGDQIVGVFYLAEVQVAISDLTANPGQPCVLKFPNNTYVDNQGQVHAQSWSGDLYIGNDKHHNPTVYAINEQATVTLTGGGSGLLGVSLIHTGWIGNVTNCNIAGKYGGGGYSETWKERPQFVGKYPFVDKGPDTPVPTGEDTAFRFPNKDEEIGRAEGTSTYTTSAWDAPSVLFDNQFQGQLLTSIVGSMTFTDYLAAYSTSFGSSYGVVAVDPWTWTFNYVKVAKTWQDNGSADTPTNPHVVAPVPAPQLGVKITGPLFNTVWYREKK